MKNSTGQREGKRNLQSLNLISSCVRLSLSGLAVDYVLSQSDGDREWEESPRDTGEEEMKERERGSWQERRKREFESKLHQGLSLASQSPVETTLWLFHSYSCLITALTGILMEYIDI